MYNISCVMSIYTGTTLDKFKLSIESILNQTLPPHELIIVYDGQVSNEVDNFLVNINTDVNIKIERLKFNVGPGLARHSGILKATGELIAIMDSDDVSVPNRFKLQSDFFYKYPNISVCGGYIEESTLKSYSIRDVPLTTLQVIKRAKSRSPVNNVTAMFKKIDYLYVGGYPRKRTSEDYELWNKFISYGLEIVNVSDVLVKVTLDDNAMARRKGINVFKDDLSTQINSYFLGNISLLYFFRNFILYSIFRLLPTKVASFFLLLVMRTK